MEGSQIALKDPEKDKGLYRDLVAYWFLGLCNNFGYVVMLTAALEIFEQINGTKSKDVAEEVKRGVRVCNALSTGAILLADVVPSLFIKALSPFLPWFVK